MFDSYSDRARRVIFFARLAAGKKGAESINNRHLVEGLVREDSSIFPPPFDQGNVFGHPPHEPFLPRPIAMNLLEVFASDPLEGDPLADSADLPVSPDLSRTLAEAAALADKLDSESVGPLHILAAVLQSDSKIHDDLQGLGIERNAVLKAIEAGG